MKQTETIDHSFDQWIEAGQTEKHYWRDVWHYRELFFILAWRDIAVRYKQTVAGVAWAIVQPLANMLILTFIFSRIAGLKAPGDAPYALLVLSAMLPWQFFSNAVSNASQSIIANANMISKVYFPRMLVPWSTVGVSLADFGISLLLLAGVMAWYQYIPTWRILTLPIFVFLAMLAALGPAMLITALTVRYRDFRFIVPFVVQFGMWLSPVAYSSSVIQEKNLPDWVVTLYSLNPLVGVIEGFRWAVLGENPQFRSFDTLTSFLVSGLIFILGIAYFCKTEKSFADII